jgi:hypothetical protein
VISSNYPVLEFEARGIEPTEYDLRAGWNAKAANSTATFQNLEFSEDTWADYDDKSQEPVGVYDLKARFKKA